MSVRSALVFLVLLITSVLTCSGQTRPLNRATYGISGSVHDDKDQHPMENIRVDLKQGTGIPVNTTFTRGNGEFEFTGLTNGEYVVEVILKDYEPAQQKVLVSGLERRGIFIFMTRSITVVNVGSTASISAHELSVPGKAHDEYEKGLMLMYGKMDYRGAIVQFQRAIKDFPTFYEAYAQEGSAYDHLGDAASAEEALKKSVDLSSGQYSKALFILAGMLTEAKRYSDSATYARKGISVDANSWQGPYELARALMGLDQLEEAEKNAIAARDMKPDNPGIYLLLANIFIHLRDYPSLLKDLDAYIKLVPAGPESDQARQTRDNILAAQQNAEHQVRMDAQNGAPAENQDSTSSGSSAQPHDNTPPPDPDTSGLPSLPPPGSYNY